MILSLVGSWALFRDFDHIRRQGRIFFAKKGKSSSRSSSSIGLESQSFSVAIPVQNVHKSNSPDPKIKFDRESASIM